MGVYVTRGMQLRIPAGGLVLTLDGQSPPVVFEVRLDVWDHWLSIATEFVDDAEAAHARLLTKHGNPGRELLGAALEEEFRAAMQAIAATAFAFDAIYAALKERLVLEPGLDEAWRQNRTARHKRIAEVMRRAFKIRQGVPQLQEYLQRLFEFRSWAVHPPNDFRVPLLHPELDTGVEWRFVAFSASNARAFLDKAVSLLEQTFALAEERSPDAIRSWVKSSEERLAQAVDRSSSWSPSADETAGLDTVKTMTTEEIISRASRALAEAAPPRSRVILFGSHARGEARHDSDLDLLVIEPEVTARAAESVRLRRALNDIPAAFDVVVVSQELADRRAKVPGTMIDRALREGRLIAES